MLQIYYLYTLKEVTPKNRSEQEIAGYRDALEASSIGWHEQKHDVFPWLNYFWGALLKAYRGFEEYVIYFKDFLTKDAHYSCTTI